MDEGDADSSANVIDLNSPKVIEKASHSGDNDALSPLSAKFSQSSLNSALSKETKAKNESRRVSFPEDDKIISGYGEPRNPWAQAKTTSTEELIQAYTQSCQHWGVKPITKLLVQLQEIKDFSVRTHSLTLKGEKLDTKVVETLEAVFKRVQFVIMDLEATNLDEDAAAALFDMIEYYESAVNVLIGFNKNLGTRGWQAAAHMMRKMSCLRLFDGHSVPLTEQAVPFVGRALRLSNTLVTLHLEAASLSGRPMLLIVAALKMNVTLRELFLADNRLVSTDALQIANLLKFNTVLQLLDIRNNLIQDAGLCHLCTGIMNQPHNPNSPAGHNPNTVGGGLQTLVLWNNQISQQSMGKLSIALKHTVSLSTLNLGQNVLSDDGASKLKDGLLQNRSLLRLGLVGTKLTCEGAIALAEYLAESPRVIRLDLRNNDIKFGGLMALSLAFKINFSLLRLDIDKPQSKETLKELVENQETHLKNIQEYANRNKKKALQKVVTIQLEKQKKSDDNSSPGFRYMDMTHSANGVNVGASTSQNNSNNKSSSFAPSHVVIHHSEVDDSPINSPELLPTNSVSYHQVSPVIFSHSEMQKRAALAKEEAESLQSRESERSQTNIVGDSATQTVEHVTHPTTKNQGDLNPDSIHAKTNSDNSDSSVSDAETKCAAGAKTEIVSVTPGSDAEKTKTVVLKPGGDGGKTEIVVVAPGGDSAKPEIVAVTPDAVSETYSNSDMQNTQEHTSECESTNTSITDTTAESDSEFDENTTTEHLKIEDNPTIVKSSQPDHNREETIESNVTITHFDLSLFPKN